nr:hypothetical protein [Tanacetum cinerariifolium]
EIGEAAPKPKASVKRTRSSSDTSITPSTAAESPRLKAFAKGKQPAKASKAKSLSTLSEVSITEAQQLKLVTKRSMQQTHISQPSGSGTDEGNGSKPGVPDVPTDESEEELSWNYTDDEEVMNKNLIKKQGKRKTLNLSLKPLKVVKMKAMVKRIKGKILVRKKYMMKRKRKRKMNSIETSTLIREGDFKHL